MSICRVSSLFTFAIRNFTFNLKNKYDTYHNVASRHFATTSLKKGMEEFFDDPSNWGEIEVKVGRGWKVSELRIKSNEDLHKLWYVLLKELNMLLCMEHASKMENVVFPNPERIDKVKDSMANIETVVKERNNAFMMLETGQPDKRPGDFVQDMYGRREYRDFTECHIPRELNVWYQRYKYVHHPELDNLNALYKENFVNDARKKRKKEEDEVAQLFSEFPDLDLEALKARYPDVDVDKVRKSKNALAHCDHNY